MYFRPACVWASGSKYLISLGTPLIHGNTVTTLILPGSNTKSSEPEEGPFSLTGSDGSGTASSQQLRPSEWSSRRLSPRRRYRHLRIIAGISANTPGSSALGRVGKKGHFPRLPEGFEKFHTFWKPSSVLHWVRGEGGHVIWRRIIG